MRNRDEDNNNYGWVLGGAQMLDVGIMASFCVNVSLTLIVKLSQRPTQKNVLIYGLNVV